MIDEIAIAVEPGLGDHFICNGLINHISQFYNKIYLPVYDISVHPNWATVENLYSTNSQVRLVRLPRFVRHWESQRSWAHFFSTWNIPTLQVKLDPNRYPVRWYKWFYHQLLIDWHTHQTKCVLPPLSPMADQLFDRVVGDHQQYVVVHDHSTAGHTPLVNMHHTDLPIVRITPGISSNLLDWRRVIAGATEIHAVQSSVFWLCNLMQPSIQGKLYYHKARPLEAPIDPEDFPSWTFVDYDR